MSARHFLFFAQGDMIHGIPSENLEYDLSEAKISSQESPLQKPGKVMNILLRKNYKSSESGKVIRLLLCSEESQTKSKCSQNIFVKEFLSQ